MTEEKAFSFLPMPDRSSKPRVKGITMCLDQGLGLRNIEDLLTICAEYVDLWKLGWATTQLQSREIVRKKVELLRSHDIFAADLDETGLLPPPSSVQVAQGIVDEGFRLSLPDGILLVLSDREVFGIAKRRRTLKHQTFHKPFPSADLDPRKMFPPPITIPTSTPRL